MELTAINILLLYLFVMNIITFVVYGFDKYSAQKNLWRTSEAVLWILALLGGSIGALLGMKQFRHKTKKASFQLVLAIIIALQVACAYALYELGVI